MRKQLLPGLGSFPPAPSPEKKQHPKPLGKCEEGQKWESMGDCVTAGGWPGREEKSQVLDHMCRDPQPLGASASPPGCSDYSCSSQAKQVIGITSSEPCVGTALNSLLFEVV